MQAEQTSFLFGANAPFIEELYARYLGDANAVDAEWRTFFEALGLAESATLRQIWDRLRKTYCGKIGVEYMHISDPDQKAWIQERIEHIENHTEFTVEGRRAILDRVVEAEGLERYLGVKFV